MPFSLFKQLLPNRPLPLRVLRGPFRGARIVLNPRHSLRKVMGLYEHELNSWLDQVLNRVTRVIDVGANDGYFTFGCAAAFRRLRKTAEIIGLEPQAQHVKVLRESIKAQADTNSRVAIIPSLAGSTTGEARTTLDALAIGDRCNTLIKIDVEGAELEVVAGAHSWLIPSNYFVIEVHDENFLPELVRIFRLHDHPLRVIHQRPLPILGRETRDKNNWWAVTAI